MELNTEHKSPNNNSSGRTKVQSFADRSASVQPCPSPAELFSFEVFVIYPFGPRSIGFKF